MLSDFFMPKTRKNTQKQENIKNSRKKTLFSFDVFKKILIFASLLQI
jgi:hypothetical protein